VVAGGLPRWLMVLVNSMIHDPACSTHVLMGNDDHFRLFFNEIGIGRLPPGVARCHARDRVLHDTRCLPVCRKSKSKCLDYSAASHSKGMLLEHFTLFKNRRKTKTNEIISWWK